MTHQLACDADYLDGACFRLSRILELAEEAGGMDYRGRPPQQIAAVAMDMKCAVGRERFRDGVERHHEWLRSLIYAQYLLTTDWLVVRYFALRNAGYICAECGAGRDLHVHHRTYARRGVERLSDVVVLCPDCHALAHGKPARRSRRGGLRKVDFGMAFVPDRPIQQAAGAGEIAG